MENNHSRATRDKEKRNSETKKFDRLSLVYLIQLDLTHWSKTFLSPNLEAKDISNRGQNSELALMTK